MSGEEDDDVIDVLVEEPFDFCGRGDPIGTAVWMRDVLRMFDREEDRGYEAERATLLLQQPNGDMPPVSYFALYHLDNLGLTEHGTSIRCSWLTDKGKAVPAQTEKMDLVEGR